MHRYRLTYSYTHPYTHARTNVMFTQMYCKICFVYAHSTFRTHITQVALFSFLIMGVVVIASGTYAHLATPTTLPPLAPKQVRSSSRLGQRFTSPATFSPSKGNMIHVYSQAILSWHFFRTSQTQVNNGCCSQYCLGIYALRGKVCNNRINNATSIGREGTNVNNSQLCKTGCMSAKRSCVSK